MISAVFENNEIAFEVYRMVKDALREEGYQKASELRNTSHVLVMRKGDSMVSVSYRSVNQTEVKFVIDGSDDIVERAVLRFLASFSSISLSKFFGTQIGKEGEESLSETLKKLLEKARAEGKALERKAGEKK